ncbi:MAG: leucyl/phenylalanyl-tRNA--protein transferase [Sphingobium sp.]|nr:leucyl/phenylalanyl-tRNA--protein transferase [Sphingobium sp.]MCP5400249.1 leucyl/phenylalanyl-tRNA--protein transferase [Sphingomonas sp.]
MPIPPLLLLRAYAIGIFPMADDRNADKVYWVEPKKRAILPLDQFHLSRSLAKTIKSNYFRVSVNEDFEAVVRLCAQAAPDRPTTWINHEIEESYAQLHRLGFAHSVECWEEGALVGGLYGVSLGRAFFGESMFSRRTDASKIALAWLVARMRLGGCTLLDCQFMTDHLRSLGAVEIAHRDYCGLLDAALSDVSLDDESALLSAGPGSEAERAFAPDLSEALSVSGPVSGQFIAQLLTQTS